MQVDKFPPDCPHAHTPSPASVTARTLQALHLFDHWSQVLGRGADCDLDARDPKAAQRELKELHAQQETLAKKINKKVFDEGSCSLKNNRVLLFF